MNTSYLLDPSDRVVAVNAAWIAFAEANEAPSLPGRVMGQSLWTFIANRTVQELYRTLFHRVRATEHQVTLPFRCDSPVVQRFMALAVGLGEGPQGTLNCQVQLLREEAQPPAALSLYAAMARRAITPRSESIGNLGGEHAGDLLVVCSWCKRLEVEGWCEIDEALGRQPLLFTEPVRPITHGLCPECALAVYAELE
ncbi:MAG: hypothetical protein H7Z74_01575 [Anaerolineae bacterium]|nr:hypothetical protein [Gemmatimonadaceae bacterium]